MPSSVEIDSPLPGDTVGTNVIVTGAYSTDLDVSQAGADQVECKLFDKTNTQVGTTGVYPILLASGPWTFNFTGLSVDVNYKFEAKLFVNGAQAGGTDSVDEVDVTDQGGGMIGITIAPIP